LEYLRNARELDRQKAFELLAQALETSHQRTDALVDTSRKIANLESVDTVLLYIMDLSLRLLDSDVAAIGLWDAAGERLELEYHAGASGTRVIPSSEITNQLILKAVKKSNTLRYPEDISDPDAIWFCKTEDVQINTATVVPLSLETQSVGGMWIGRERRESYRQEDVSYLEHLADQAVIALEHAIMTERLQSVAVMEERTRIAHEMHDNLAQILAFLSLEMQTLEAYVKTENSEQALAEIQQARAQINEAQADVRENILSLRTTLSGTTGVVPALREFISEYAIQTGIDAQINCAFEDIKGLSPIAETQLIYIVQEALANVRKHAQAEHASVDINVRDDRLYVTVSDDGVGSDVLTSSGHFGIQTMRERAESIGGKMTIDSHPGEGTNIRFWLPILQSSA
jgi:two-component system nitrate/nitrite sensor histidine kinase NarX